MKLLDKAAAIGMCLCSCLMAKDSYPVACSAFSGRGDAATAIIADRKLGLQITPAAGGKPLSLPALIDDDGLIGCGVFFDRSSRYVAVGVNHLGLKTGPLNITVADLMTNRLISSFVIQPNADVGVSLKLAGFLPGRAVLVVMGTGAADHPTKSFSTTIFGITGEQEQPSQTRTLPADAGGVGNVSFADVAHNRLWFKSSPQFCPLRSVPLIGDGPEGANVDEASARAACDVGSAIAYPDESTLIVAVTRDSGDLVTRVDLAQHKVDEITLLNTEGRRRYTSVGRGILSADGEVFAITRILLVNSPLGDAHSYGTELDVMQVSPLKIIAKVRLKPDIDTASISIGHRNGVVTVLSFGDGRWSFEPLKSE
jgi:hypothetical protein